MAPVLVTPRLRLRAHVPGDLSDLAEMWASAEVTRYIGGRPFTREEVWARTLRHAGHWQWMDYGFWVLEDRETGRFLGEAGFASFERQIDPPITDPEIGWALRPEAQGRGLATEAVQRIVEWGDRRFRGAPTACIIDTPNVASIKVARKCGYAESRRAVYRGAEITVYARANASANTV